LFAKWFADGGRVPEENEKHEYYNDLREIIAQCYGLLIHVHMRQGDFAYALECLQRVIEFHPRYRHYPANLDMQIALSKLLNDKTAEVYLRQLAAKTGQPLDMCFLNNMQKIANWSADDTVKHT